MQGKLVESVDATWAQLVSRAVRVALTRQDVSYAQLAAELTRLGVPESARSVEGKVQRGTFRFVFFLQALTASGADCPVAWARVMARRGTWEERATAVFQDALALQPWLSWRQLAHRLAEIGVEVQPEVVEGHVADGTFSAAFFFQCAAVCRFEGIHLFLDTSSLNSAALAGKPAG
ncbi:DUF6471 domain-containing protein [Paraburkholderia caffeinilytica]|uniref:DUF6471 domain-containing protein n=1 Tax=Paraburkholderia caffeinilytica TaxID=1761016 RepID=UPI0038BC1E30